MQRRRQATRAFESTVTRTSPFSTEQRVYWRPIWRRCDSSFVWNHHILTELANSAINYLTVTEGLPSSVFEKGYNPEGGKEEEGGSTSSLTSPNAPISPTDPYEGPVGPPTRLTKCLWALESLLIPVVNGFVKQVQLDLPVWDIHGRASPTEGDPVILTIISRRSQFRAGESHFSFDQLFRIIRYITHP